MKIELLFAVSLITAVVSGQDVLDEYVKYGLENNLALQQKQVSYRKSIEALREARAFFYPEVSLQARYTRSEGGRVIEFPAGDLLNPVYITLNQLTGSSLFPFIDNQEIRFLRPREHETKLRLIQPVVNPEIYYNSKIRKELTNYEDEDVSQYKRELVADIKKAYYNAATADGILAMLRETRELLLENIRVNRKLIENGKATPDYLYRSQTELNKFDQELQNAVKNREIAFAYFNFLLNRSLTDSITIKEPGIFPSLENYTGDIAGSAAGNREELKKLETYRNISDLKVKMDNSGRLPEMFIAVDYGFQGPEYIFNRDHDYVQASAVLSWNLFSGFRNRAKTRQSVMDREMADVKLEEARKQIELQVINIMNELLTAEKGIIAAESRLVNAREGFRLVKRKYEEGQSSLIEFIDSRTSVTQSEENLIISKYNYLSSFAEFEKVAAINIPE